jgi:hypothetical protein
VVELAERRVDIGHTFEKRGVLLDR